MFSKYFSFKYFGSRFFAKGKQLEISKSGDVTTSLTKVYSNSGDIVSVVTPNASVYTNSGDIWVSVIKRKPQERVSFSFDIETEIIQEC
jgi:hypothetical protein